MRIYYNDHLFLNQFIVSQKVILRVSVFLWLFSSWSAGVMLQLLGQHLEPAQRTLLSFRMTLRIVHIWSMSGPRLVHVWPRSGPGLVLVCHCLLWKCPLYGIKTSAVKIEPFVKTRPLAAGGVTEGTDVVSISKCNLSFRKQGEE